MAGRRSHGSQHRKEPRSGVRLGSGALGARIALPAPRALMGGSLLVLAASGVLVAHRAASAPPQTSYVVATRDVSAGQVITAKDLGTLAVDLPAGVGAVAAEEAEDLVGRTAATDLHELDLLRPDDVASVPQVVAGSVEVTVELDPARTPSDLRPGHLVNVLSTDQAGGTEVLARDVTVSEVRNPDETGIGVSEGIRVKLLAPDQDTASALVDAAVVAELTVVVPQLGAGGDG